MIRKRLLVTGCPRSGTTYISQLLGMLNIDCAHERMGADGTVSSFFNVEDEVVDYIVPDAYEAPFSEHEFERIVLLVREPWACIHSMRANLPMATWDWLQMHCPEIDLHLELEHQPRPLEAVAAFWLRWNQRIQAELRPDFTVRIEDFRVPLSKKRDYRVNVGSAPRYAVGDVVPVGLKVDIGELARSFGYNVA